MKKYQPKCMLKKSRFRNYYAASTQDFQLDICAKMQHLIDENQEYNDHKNYEYLCNLYAALAIVYALEDRELSREESIEKVKIAMYSFLQPKVKQMSDLSKLPIFIPFLRRVMPLKFKMELGYGWDVEFPKVDKDSFAMTTHRCIYTTLYQKYGIPELTPIFCHVDDLLYGNLPGAYFEFTQRLGIGGTMCDYCFRKKYKQ